MKTILLPCILLLPFFLFAQKDAKSKVIVNPKNKVDSTYIGSIYEKMQLRFDINNSTSKFSFANPGLRDFDLAPNQNFKTRLAMAYRWLNLSFSFAPQVGSLNNDNDERGNSDILGVDLSFNLRGFQGRLAYQNITGYFLENTADYRSDLLARGILDSYITFPDFESTEISSENFYYHNNKKFSSRFARNQNEIQLKSAGSLISFLGGYYADIDGRNQDFTNLQFLPEIEEIYPNRNQSLYFITGTGYAYNYIFKKKFYVTALALPVIGVQFSRLFLSDNVTESSATNLTLGGLGEFSIGYNSNRWFTGAFVNYANYSSPNASFRISGEQSFVMLFVGYRFPPPRFIRNGFDWLKNIGKHKTK